MTPSLLRQATGRDRSPVGCDRAPADRHCRPNSGRIQSCTSLTVARWSLRRSAGRYNRCCSNSVALLTGSIDPVPPWLQSVRCQGCSTPRRRRCGPPPRRGSHRRGAAQLGFCTWHVTQCLREADGVLATVEHLGMAIHHQRYDSALITCEVGQDLER
jgi:hypothetical protein